MSRVNPDLSGIDDFMSQAEPGSNKNYDTMSQLTDFERAVINKEIPTYQTKEENVRKAKTKENAGNSNNKRQINNRPPSASGPSGGKARIRMTSADKKDKVMHYERENNVLKAKGTLLSNEITKMKTKLHRIEELMRSRGRITEGNEYDISDMQRDLEDECAEIKDQNKDLKEKVRKLNVIQRGLDAPTTASAKPNKYAHVQGKLTKSSNVSKRYQQEAQDIRAQLTVNNRKIMELENELKIQNEQAGGVGSGSADQVRKEIAAMQTEIRQCETEMEAISGDFVKNEEIFEKSRSYQQEISEKIRKTEAEYRHQREEQRKLALDTKEVKSLATELAMLEDEKSKIERTLNIKIAEPFLHKNDGQTIQSRIAECKQRKKQNERLINEAETNQKVTLDEVNTKRAELNELQGQLNLLKSQHKEAKEQYQKTIGSDPTRQDAMQGLLKTDPGMFNTMVTDLAMGQVPGAEPIWAKLPFLERGVQGVEEKKDHKSYLQDEIVNLKHECAEFSQELQKAQSLLKLQSDIERENTVFYNTEVKRLTLIETSSKAKVEELARRADDKAKTINDLQQNLSRLTMSRAQSPDRRAPEEDGVSEFSVATYESEIRHNENILDFKIEDAEFYVECFKQVAGFASAYEAGRALVTVVTIDFYNHNTETSQMAEGIKANYQSQFSFVNTVDSFYINFLMKETLKMDVYVSKNNSAIHLGRCEVMLRDLIDQSIKGQDINMRTPLIQARADIKPVSVAANIKNSAPEILGTIKFKMRLRKPINQAMQFYTRTNELENMQKNIVLNSQLSVKSPKKLVTITVVGCQNLKMPYGDISNVAPFFYYQFYTFEDRYSHNGTTTNPRFNDTHSYEMLYDAKAMNYFEREKLEIIFFDDNAPIIGTEIGEEQKKDDLIGRAFVPLGSLASSCAINNKFDIRAPSNSVVGQVEVKITVMDLQQIQQDTLFHTVKAAQELHYNKQWEQDVVMRIARKLATLNCEIGLMFGIFSQGQRNCTHENFKHCCLNRLNLRKEGLTERELDLLLVGSEHTRDSNLIEINDFIGMFESSIVQARNDRLNEIAEMGTGTMRGEQLGTMRGDQSMISHQSGMTLHQQAITDQLGYASQSASMLHAFNETEMTQILQEAIRQGYSQQILESAKRYQHGLHHIKSADLKNVLHRVGQIDRQDAHKVVAMLEVDDFVQLERFEQVMTATKKQMREKNRSIQTLKRAIEAHPGLVRALEKRDLDGDGAINVDGFKAALRVKETAMSEEELEEVFNLVCEPDGYLRYAEWIGINFHSSFREQFDIQSNREDKLQQTLSQGGTYRDPVNIAESSLSAIESQHQLKQMQELQDKNKAESAKKKIERYMREQDINLSVIFRVMDANSSGKIDFPEFKSRVKGLHMQLEDDEIVAIFKSMDIDNSNTISYSELCEQFSKINTQQILGKLHKLFTAGNINQEYHFNKYAAKDGQRASMSKAEFERMIKEVNNNVTQLEMAHVFRHFDKSNKGYIRKEEFLAAFDRAVVQQGFNLSIEDIIKPLATKARKHGVNLAELFDKYDVDKNHMLDADELTDALQRNKLLTTKEDDKVLKRYFADHYNSNEITKEEFVHMMTKFTEKKAQRKFVEADAKRALVDVKNKVHQLNTSARALLMANNPESTELINIACFKLAINSLACLTPTDIDNLAKYMDEKNEGYISIGSFEAKVNNAAMTGSFRSTARSNKWVNK